ncbi:Ribonuclease P protein component [hydrothermal vent metagenome]|uniref:Ribonuclease P protein component n=1 Tax=hydrothermal vent metagenome TaxID=652676 RepID=A0A3B1AJD3_9ZZZZ
MLSERFTRSVRLTNAVDYANVFDRACKQSSQHFTLLCRKNNQKFARLGLAIAKKQLRLAVSRNRIKRLVRESFRHNQDLLTGFDIVVLTRTSVMKCSNNEIGTLLDQQWLKLVARCKKSC